MKKMATVFLTIVMVFSAGLVFAETALLPDGTVVSAAVDVANKTATVRISGVNPDNVEFYAYEGVEKFGAVNEFTVNLNEGRRFNFTVNGKYALLTPEMAAYPPEFFGPGIGMDCGNSGGCAFLIVGN
ncbi:MAG: hypothetical protein PHH24_00395 [Candidatus Moranbacteria bacterium]|jgi:hypothetical protein|nr:hypothetical protein [Candidatus Moranbacteria bacterium]MDD5652189.1 hypothetical protein [Candidatus Moranbacteria bacterium]MDX9855691.1 hypothetical protein [Candidatus Moranbacteria bacterium]